MVTVYQRVRFKMSLPAINCVIQPGDVHDNLTWGVGAKVQMTKG